MSQSSAPSTQEIIAFVCDEIKEMLIMKNRKYGDSAIAPVNIFYRGTAEDALRVRMDDKLSRIMNRQNDEDEDPEDDLIGYLILHKVQKLKSKVKESVSSIPEESHPVL
jgi:hypothetical protein